MDRLMRRVLEGRHTVVVTPGGLVELPERFRAGRVVVDCRQLPRPLEPLIEIERQARELLGPPLPPYPVESEHPPDGTGMDDWMRRAVMRQFVNELDRLAAVSEAPPVVVVRAAQAAHPSSLAALERLIGKAACPVPIVLGVDTEDHPAVAALIETVRATQGPDAVLRVEHETTDVADAPPDPPATEVDLAALPTDVRLVLRAAAAVGSPFEVRVVAHLLALGPLEVLQVLQRAADHGVPLEDLGGGRLGLPEALRERLVQGTLPSLLRAWDARAAKVLASHGTEPSRKPPAVGHDDPDRAPDTERYPTTPAPSPDAARAADHAERAGNVDLAVEQLVVAARRATDLGGFDEALTLVERGHRALDAAAESPRRARLRTALDVQLARVHWMAASTSEVFSLASALEALAGCEQRLTPDDPPALSAEVRRTIAKVRYDMGDPESLEIALEALSRAGTDLLSAGQPVEAARLLNDEAAVWLRIGDPVRANHLLEQSREAFRGMLPGNDGAREALAHTDHLIAKLLLKTPAKPGKEDEALARALEYAESARGTFDELGLRADAARTEETLGRIEHRAGRIESAFRWLVAGATTQKGIGDAMGLARSAEALAELLGEAGEAEAGLEMLQSSIAVNLQKGSPQGAAFNRRGLALLVERIPDERRRALAPVIERLEAALARASDAQRAGGLDRPGRLG